MFYECQNLENIYFRILNSNSTLKNKFFLLTHQNLIICGENNDDILFDSNLFMRQNIFCDNNQNYKKVQNKYKCHLKNLNNICDI